MGRAMQMNTLASRLTHVSNHYLSMCRANVLEGAYCNPRNDLFLDLIRFWCLNSKQRVKAKAKSKWGGRAKLQKQSSSLLADKLVTSLELTVSEVIFFSLAVLPAC